MKNKKRRSGREKLLSTKVDGKMSLSYIRKSTSGVRLNGRIPKWGVGVYRGSAARRRGLYKKQKGKEKE